MAVCSIDKEHEGSSLLLMFKQGSISLNLLFYFLFLRSFINVVKAEWWFSGLGEHEAFNFILKPTQKSLAFFHATIV